MDKPESEIEFEIAMAFIDAVEASLGDLVPKDLYALARRGAEMQKPRYTYGHSLNHAQQGGCQLHNLQCGYPDCDRRPLPPPPSGEQEHE